MTEQPGLALSRKENGVGWMTFNNPERYNALSVEMRHAVIDVLTDMRADDDVRVVVMSGAGGKAFVSGADISQFEKQRSTPEQQAEYTALTKRMDEAMTGLGKPLIAMIRGFCLGGGLGVALNADIRVASSDSRFGVPAARLSIGYPYPSIRKLMDLIGPAYAKEMLFTAKRFPADVALRMGLINDVVEADQLEDTVRDLAQTIGANAPLTIRASKTIVEELLKDEDDHDLELCAEMVRRCMESDDFVEGRRAFMEKRRPQFTGK
ncbi:MAG: enoyl-CoA hydratase [Alphaproteobacteria bacterium]